MQQNLINIRLVNITIVWLLMTIVTFVCFNSYVSKMVLVAKFRYTGHQNLEFAKFAIYFAPPVRFDTVFRG